MAGLRVVRGPNWKWQSQDGGDGHVGTVVEKGKKDGWMTVLWDNGLKNSYRSGAEKSKDLLVLDNGPAGTRHPGVTCDICSENNIRGIRWKCANCDDYDLCTECYGNDKHDIQHQFKRFDVPSGPGVKVGKRKSTEKLQARGAYKGAKVTRGKDWQKGDQDGGEGNVGKITKVGYKHETGDDIHCVVVEWPHSSNGYIYCFGWNGRVDVKCTSAVIGWGYYKAHLPVLGDADKLIKKETVDDSSDDEDLGDALAKLLVVGLLAGAAGAAGRSDRKEETMRKFSSGDQVRLDEDPATVKRLQQGHGGFNILMLAFLGKNGIVKNIDDDGDLNVTFGGIDWCLNPAAVTVVNRPSSSVRPSSPDPRATTRQRSKPGNTFQQGDQVKVCVTEDELKAMQKGHGGWSPQMHKAVGKIGIITSIDSDGDIKVKFTEGTWIFNPEACESMDSSVAKSKGKAPGGGQLCGENNITFCVGDKVTIGLSVDLIVMFQEGHGGWSADMATVVGKTGTVKEVRGDGDLRVTFGTKCWTFNPAIFILQASAAGDGDQNCKDTNTDNSKTSGDSQYQCGVCRDKNISIVFNCGHFTCDTCSKSIDNCHICRNPIAMRTKMFV